MWAMVLSLYPTMMEYIYVDVVVCCFVFLVMMRSERCTLQVHINTSNSVVYTIDST